MSVLDLYILLVTSVTSPPFSAEVLFFLVTVSHIFKNSPICICTLFFSYLKLERVQLKIKRYLKILP